MSMIFGGWAKEEEENKREQEKQHLRELLKELTEEPKPKEDDKPMGSFLDD